MRRLRLLTPCAIALLAFVVIGCGDDDSPTAPPPPAQVEWHVPADVPTIAAAADSARQGEAIVLAPGTYLEHGIVLDVGVDLRGESGKAGDVIIDGQGLGRVLAVQLGDSTVVQPGDTTTVIESIEIRGGVADIRGGGGLLATMAIEARNVRFAANSTVGMGGAVFVQGVGARFVSCVFDSNRTTEPGAAGGALVAGGSGDHETAIDFESCSFTANVAAGPGGGAYVAFVDLHLYLCSFTDNSAQLPGSSGGGLVFAGYASQAAVIDTCVFIRNVSEDIGGGLKVDGSLTLTRSAFEGNRARRAGAVMTGEGFTIADCVFTGNEAVTVAGDFYSGQAGALLLPGSGHGVTNCEFQGNTADFGSAIFGNGSTEMQGCTFVGNTDGGAIEWFGGTTTLAACVFRDNESLSGGAFYLGGGTMDLTSCEFTGNSAWRGGVGYISWATVTLTDCVVTGNEATATGGAFHVESQTLSTLLVIDGGVVNSNNAATSGGAIFLGENAELQATDVEIRGNTAPEAPACWVGTDCTAEFTCCDMESSEVAVSGTGSVHFSYEGCPELPKLRSR